MLYSAPIDTFRAKPPSPSSLGASLSLISLHSIMNSQLSLDAGVLPSISLYHIVTMHRSFHKNYTIIHKIVQKDMHQTNAPKMCWYPQIGKLCWYPHSNKLLQKCMIFNKAINLHSRGPMEQYFYVWEPHRGCFHKVKKVCWCHFIREGQQSHKYAF